MKLWVGVVLPRETPAPSILLGLWNRKYLSFYLLTKLSTLLTEISQSFFLNICLCLQEFGFCCFSADLVAQNVPTPLRTSLCSSKLTSRSPRLNHRAKKVRREVSFDREQSTQERSGKLQGEGLTLGRMIYGSFDGLCRSARLSWHHPGEQQRHIYPGTESSLSA